MVACDGADGIDLDLFEGTDGGGRALFAMEAASGPKTLLAEEIAAGCLVGDVGERVSHGRHFSTNGLRCKNAEHRVLSTCNKTNELM